MPYVASHRFARMSPRKVRPVADVVRGQSVDDALESLRYMPHRGARLLEKVVKSARANAEDQGHRHPEELKLQDVRVDGGPSTKRVLPRCRGMAHVILKRMCHIRVRLEDPDVDSGD
jgi:large subunit ribosomal protein L22